MLTERRQPAIRRRYLQTVNLLSEDAICKLLTCCQAAKLLLEDAICSCQVVDGRCCLQVLKFCKLLSASCQLATGKMSTCYRKVADLQSERCYMQAVKLLTEDGVCKLSGCCRKVLYASCCWKMLSASCQLLPERCWLAIGRCCMLQEKMSSLDADGKTSTYKLSTCYWKDVNLLSERC